MKHVNCLLVIYTGAIPY